MRAVVLVVSFVAACTPGAPVADAGVADAGSDAGTDVDGAVLRVSPATCNFGAVPVGGIGTCEVELHNDGGRGLILDDVAFDANTSPAFFVAGRPPDDTEEIAPGDAVTLVVELRPDDAVTFAGDLIIASNGAPTPFDLALSGT